MNVRVLILGAALVVAVTSCTKEPPKSNPPPGQPASTDNNKPSDCGGLQTSYNDVLASSSANTCTADTDCACYNGGFTKEHGCGGVTNKTTADKLVAIRKSADDHCKSGIQCAAWVCNPACAAGKCENK